jgi:hypothetical protein
MTSEEALAFLDSAADGGLGAPDYSEAYSIVKEALRRLAELEACLTTIKRDPKLWKAGGAGGQDQFAGLPPALRLIHEVLPD